MMRLIKMVRENIRGILLFSMTFLFVWRIHEYSHLLTSYILKIKITMSLNTWISNKSDILLYASGPLSTAILSFIGVYLTLRHNGISKVLGFYMTFSGFLLTLSSLISRTPYFTAFTLNNEYIWKLIVFIPITLSLLLGIAYGNLNLKPSCVMWLSIIALIVGSTVVLLDKLIWWAYNENIIPTRPLFGQIPLVYLIDILLIAIAYYVYILLRKSTVQNVE